MPVHVCMYTCIHHYKFYMHNVAVTVTIVGLENYLPSVLPKYLLSILCDRLAYTIKDKASTHTFQSAGVQVECNVQYFSISCFWCLQAWNLSQISSRISGGTNNIPIISRKVSKIFLQCARFYLSFDTSR